MIIFRPTKGTAMYSCPIPSPQDVAQIITQAKTRFPKKDISLGCMRPRSHERQIIETAALEAGVNRMEIPSKTTLEHAQSLGYSIKKIGACCALPQELEHHAVIS
jgi:uncharacterized radical SAM superfamily protein